MLESSIVLFLGFDLASVAYLVRGKDLLGELPRCSQVVHTWDVPAKRNTYQDFKNAKRLH